MEVVGECLFLSQTKLSYEAKCLGIEYAERLQRKELQGNYIINKRSYLGNLRDFDIAAQLPQDIMHFLLGGGGGVKAM